MACAARRAGCPRSGDDSAATPHSSPALPQRCGLPGGRSGASRGSPPLPRDESLALRGTPLMKRGAPPVVRGAPLAARGESPAASVAPPVPRGAPLFAGGAPPAASVAPLFVSATPLLKRGVPLSARGAPLFIRGAPLGAGDAPLFKRGVPHDAQNTLFTLPKACRPVLKQPAARYGPQCCMLARQPIRLNCGLTRPGLPAARWLWAGQQPVGAAEQTAL